MEDEAKNKKQRQGRREKLDFDKELQEEMEDEIEEIRNRNISGVEKDELINRIYEEKKKRKREKELRKDRQKADMGALASGLVSKRVREADPVQHMDDREEGEINDAVAHAEPEPSIPLNQLGQYIKPIVLTRSKLEDMVRLPRFEDLIKGCFVRCNCDKSSNSNNYMLAQIVGTVQTQQSYTVVKASTNIKIKLQLGNRDVQVLPMSVVSNQPLSSTLEIDRWFNRNRDNIPKVENLKHKREMLEQGLTKEISNEEIESNIMRNIERILKKGKESKEDVSSYISFLNTRIHHLEKTIKDHEFNTGAVEQHLGSGPRRQRRDYQQIQPRRHHSDLDDLLKKKQEVDRYLKDLKQIQLEQYNKKILQKKERQKDLPQALSNQKTMESIINSYENTIRPDVIAAMLHEKLHLMGLASQCQAVRDRIFTDHAEHTLNIEI